MVHCRPLGCHDHADVCRDEVLLHPEAMPVTIPESHHAAGAAPVGSLAKPLHGEIETPGQVVAIEEGDSQSFASLQGSGCMDCKSQLAPGMLTQVKLYILVQPWRAGC